MKRVQHLLNTLKTNWSAEPAIRGAAKMTAGAILVAEGLFGAFTSVFSGDRRSRGIGGLAGNVVSLFLGFVFIILGNLKIPANYPDQMLATGKIAAFETGHGSKGKTMYSAVYSFEVEGREYRFPSAARTSWQPKIGDSIEIAYSAADPKKARRVDGIGSKIHWILFGCGALVLGTGMIGISISLALIGFGVWLFLQGRKDRKSVNASGGFISDLLSLAKRARNGEIDINRTAVGMAGGQQGDIDLFSQVLAGDVTTPTAAPTPPPSSLPPAGWYADPNDSSLQRWWDGTQWTDHQQ